MNKRKQKNSLYANINILQYVTNPDVSYRDEQVLARNSLRKIYYSFRFSFSWRQLCVQLLEIFMVLIPKIHHKNQVKQ